MNKLKLSYLLVLLSNLNIQTSLNQYLSNFQARLITDGFNIEFDFNKLKLNNGILIFEIDGNNNKIIEISNKSTHINYFLNLDNFNLEIDKYTTVLIKYYDYIKNYDIDEFYIRHIDKLNLDLKDNLEFNYPMLIKDNIVYVKKEIALVDNKIFIPNDLKSLNSNIFKTDKYVQEDLVYTSFYLNIDQKKYELKKVINQEYLYLNLSPNQIKINKEFQSCNLEIEYEHKYSYNLKFNINLSTLDYLQGNEPIYEYKCDVKDV